MRVVCMVVGLALATVAVSGSALAQGASGAGGTVTIYSERDPSLVGGIFATFQWTTGIRVNYVHVPKGVVDRMKADLPNSAYDVFLGNDVEQLMAAKSAGVTQPSSVASLIQSLPLEMKDKDGHWYALSRRIRVIVAAKDRVPADTISYEDLADPKWRGRVCLRSGTHPYNVALVASMIAHQGRDKTRDWLAGVKANLARKPEGGDRDQIRGLHEGVCDLAVVNSHYLGRMMVPSAPADHRAWAQSVKLMFPNSAGRGVHVNISGIALGAKPANRENALRLMEFLGTAMGQRIYVFSNAEYPAVTNYEPAPHLGAWGPFKADPLPFADIVSHAKAAAELATEVGFDTPTQ